MFSMVTFMFCSSGLTHKLERTPAESEMLVEELDCERSEAGEAEDGTENDSGYLSDSDCDD